MYERKTKWRRLDDTEFQAEKPNYKSAAGLEDILDEQVREEAKLVYLSRERFQVVMAQIQNEQGAGVFDLWRDGKKTIVVEVQLLERRKGQNTRRYFCQVVVVQPELFERVKMLDA